MPTLDRRETDYESVYDELVESAGGRRVASAFAIPPKTLNADYYFDLPEFELVLELKQTVVYRRADTVDDYMSKLLRGGRVAKFASIGPGRIRIDPDSLSSSEWNRFYRRFRPSVTTHLDKAAAQLKDTDGLIGTTSKRRIFGVVVVNSGDYNLSVDLLHRLISWRVQNKWKAGRYSKIDFVSCLAMDMAEEGRHPLHSRHISRDASDRGIETAIRFLFESWLLYGADAVGAEVVFDPDATSAPDPINLETKISGKRRWVLDSSLT